MPFLGLGDKFILERMLATPRHYDVDSLPLATSITDLSAYSDSDRAHTRRERSSLGFDALGPRARWDSAWVAAACTLDPIPRPFGRPSTHGETTKI